MLARCERLKRCDRRHRVLAFGRTRHATEQSQSDGYCKGRIKHRETGSLSAGLELQVSLVNYWMTMRLIQGEKKGACAPFSENWLQYRSYYFLP